VATLRTTLAHLMSSLTGLDYQVALNWLNAENSQVGHGTNPLGIQCGNSRGSGLEIGCQPASGGRSFAIYRSSLDGIRAAAWLLMHGSHYGGVRAAIAAHDPAAERLALVRSGWAAGGYHGGSGFSGGGITGSIPTGAGGGGPNANLASATSQPLGDLLPPGTTVAKLKAAESSAGVSTADDYRLTQGDANRLAGALHWPKAAGLASSINLLLYQALGQPNSFDPGFTEQANQNIANALATIPTALGDAARGALINGAILLVILVLAYRGIQAILGATPSV
jgi:hypothetical protein